MKALYLLFIVGLLVACGSKQELDIVVGEWQLEEGPEGADTFEHWSKTSDNGYEGIGFTLRASDTVFVEHLRIFEKEGKWWYEAEVAHNDGPIQFEIKKIQADGFFAENAAHDFPKSIDYKVTEGKMQAVIAGEDKIIELVYNRVGQ